LPMHARRVSSPELRNWESQKQMTFLCSAAGMKVAVDPLQVGIQIHLLPARNLSQLTPCRWHIPRSQDRHFLERDPRTNFGCLDRFDTAAPSRM
jgi:hypothetical protein